MNILFCNYEYPPLGGGGGVANAWLAETLAERHRVTVLTSGADGLAPEETVRGVRVVRVPVHFRRRLQAANMPSMAAYVVNGIRRGRALVRDGAFDVVNTHFVLPTGPVGDALARRAGVPNVLSVHGGDLYDPSKASSPHRHAVLRRAVKGLLNRADVVVGQSRNTVENVGRFFDPSVACERIPLGIPRTGRADVARASLGLGEDEFVMVTVGRLVRRKGVDELLEAFARLAVPRARLVVVGGGPVAGELEARARALGVHERVVFAGQASDAEKLDWMSAADLYVSTSRHEGFGLTFLEGMAVGLPVLCYDEGGQVDFVEDGGNGYLVPLGDVARFVEHARRLAGDRALRARLSAGALASVEPYFIDACAAGYEAIFERLAARGERSVSGSRTG